MRADEFVVPRVAHHELHVRAQQLPEPAREVGLFEHQALVGRSDSLHLRDEFFGLRGKVPTLA